ncbi:helix-turn-helix transcriptional regulator [Citrobacter sp. FP75]|uniref:helix-turn-helix transcriptional regulator n=1 Tax=Citrobacter sp. FP75 TaxID=1852949 RepID=UPI001BCA3A23|nr:AlpA family phage regulatory protein [Citrobacter sp. FP75]
MKSGHYFFPLSGNVRAKHVALYLGVHVSTVWRYAKTASFPKPYKLSKGVTVFDANLIRKWNRRK